MIENILFHSIFFEDEIEAETFAAIMAWNCSYVTIDLNGSLVYAHVQESLRPKLMATEKLLKSLPDSVLKELMPEFPQNVIRIHRRIPLPINVFTDMAKNIIAFFEAYVLKKQISEDPFLCEAAADLIAASMQPFFEDVDPRLLEDMHMIVAISDAIKIKMMEIGNRITQEDSEMMLAVNSAVLDLFMTVSDREEGPYLFEKTLDALAENAFLIIATAAEL
ncbi:MAG: hypothetical protein EOP06_02280 [Proteobacteria bacterium]|nr:MAG: hypothetical protein EOP06_02280 [Pseudomonadota bacterium]